MEVKGTAYAKGWWNYAGEDIETGLMTEVAIHHYKT